MRLVIFGVGDIYSRNKGSIAKEDEIVAFIDNNMSRQGQILDGVSIYAPSYISELIYDKVVIMSSYVLEMRSQLLALGCSKDSILHYMEYLGMQKRGQLEFFETCLKKEDKKKCLIITNPVGYHGGAIAATHVAVALKERAYEVTIAAPDGDRRFIEEYNEKGISFILYPNLQYAKMEELEWVNDYEAIIVNTYPMVLCAIEISKYREVMLWLLESSNVYSAMSYWDEQINNGISNDKLKIYAISKVAKRNFENGIGKCEKEVKIVTMGIPDECENFTEKSRKLTFAIFASLYPLKNQVLFLEAMKEMGDEVINECEVLIAGRDIDESYTQRVNDLAELLGNVKILGALSRKEMEEIYRTIDVLVVPSVEDTLSLVAIEAMMNEKVCIASDSTGISEFITDGYNGLICKVNDKRSLQEQIKFCFERKEELKTIGGNARKLYEERFTLDVLGKFWENEIENI